MTASVQASTQRCWIRTLQSAYLNLRAIYSHLGVRKACKGHETHAALALNNLRVLSQAPMWRLARVAGAQS